MPCESCCQPVKTSAEGTSLWLPAVGGWQRPNGQGSCDAAAFSALWCHLNVLCLLHCQAHTFAYQVTSPR